jgi:2-haloalkanoic acid dehalogenase type II
LIDWDTGVLQSLQPWCAWHGVQLGPEELLDLFTQHEAVVEAEHASMLYPDVLGETLRRMAVSLGMEATDAECAEFGASVGAWPAFADTATALRRLQQRYKLIILSNIDRASFARSNRRLGVEFDLIITAQDVGSFKPALGHFDALFEQLPALGVERDGLLHVAQGLFHDHLPAQQIGLPAVWIDRRFAHRGIQTPMPAGVTEPVRFTSLEAFADVAVGAAT